MLYDVFISHASEDKDTFVRELANKLSAEHVKIWYDEFSLRPGNSIRRSIDKGLSKSRFGIVVLSKAFFRKEWTQWELDGLIQRMNCKRDNNIIIPIWYNITFDEMIQFSPSLADRVAIIYKDDMQEVVNKVLEVIKPNGSTLIKARDIIIDYGYEPPVVTDDWWIDIIEFLGSDYYLRRWGFSLIPNNRDNSRAEQVAWAAMQMMWQQKANELEITQITKPEIILSFINSTPGLSDICISNISLIAIYAPQLTIKGSGGKFEKHFDNYYRKSLEKNTIQRQRKEIGGRGLTTTGLYPKCEKEICFRDPDFGEYKSSTIACNFVQGPLMGPSPKYYETFDYLVWLVSSNSHWLPRKIRDFLIKGLKDWNCWLWDSYEIIDYKSDKRISKFSDLALSLYESDNYKEFHLSKEHRIEIQKRIEASIYYMNLDDSVDKLYKRLIEDEKIIKHWYRKRKLTTN